MRERKWRPEHSGRNIAGTNWASPGRVESVLELTFKEVQWSKRNHNPAAERRNSLAQRGSAGKNGTQLSSASGAALVVTLTLQARKLAVSSGPALQAAFTFCVADVIPERGRASARFCYRGPRHAAFWRAGVVVRGKPESRDLFFLLGYTNPETALADLGGRHHILISIAAVSAGSAYAGGASRCIR